MPPQDQWEVLFDVARILDWFALTGDVAEAGCGYGTFTIPLATRLGGTVHAVDIDPTMVESVRRRAAAERITNIDARVGDVMSDGFGLKDSSCDACLLFNILHGESPVELIRKAQRVLRPNGILAVIHWRADIVTPRGPTLGIRPNGAMISQWATEANGLKLHDGPVNLPPWHYGVKFIRVLPQ